MGSVVVLDMGLAKGSGQFVSIGGSARAAKKQVPSFLLFAYFRFIMNINFALNLKEISQFLFSRNIERLEAVVYLTHWKEQERDFMISFKCLFDVEYLYL